MDSQSNKRVMLHVEDSDIDQMLVARMWSNITGTAPTALSSGEAFLDYMEAAARGSEPWPSLVLLDLNMPVMNGFDVLETIKADPRFARLPIVVLSTWIQEADVQRCFGLQANGFLRKSFDPEELAQDLEKAHEFWFGHAKF